MTHGTYISDPSRANARLAAPSVCRRNKITKSSETRNKLDSERIKFFAKQT